MLTPNLNSIQRYGRSREAMADDPFALDKSATGEWLLRIDVRAAYALDLSAVESAAAERLAAAVAEARADERRKCLDEIVEYASDLARGASRFFGQYHTGKETGYRDIAAHAKYQRDAAQPAPEPPPCSVYGHPCHEHGFIHGAEAEELREGIEKLIGEGREAVTGRELQRLLDRVDARDSLAYLEAKDAAQPAPGKGPTPRSVVLRAGVTTQHGVHHGI